MSTINLPPRRNRRDKGGGSKKYGRNRAKCARYRIMVGRPNGPGRPGNKRPATRRASR